LELAVKGGRAAVVRLLLQTPGINVSQCFKKEASLRVVEDFHHLFCKIPQKLKRPIKLYEDTLLHIAARGSEPAVLHELLQIPHHVTPFALVVLGYPAETPKQPERFQKERIHYDRW